MMNKHIDDMLGSEPRVYGPPAASAGYRIDKFHHHEIADRCHIINSMIDDFLRDHVAMDTQMILWCEEAQERISRVMQRASLSE